MMVNKITEVTIFESPDGGRTVYARRPGQQHRELHYQDPELKKELDEVEQQRVWMEIFSARRNNPEIEKMAQQLEILYQLGKKEK
jgi:hypothetical protein